MNTPYSLKCYLKSAIDNAVAKCAKTKDFSRKSVLSRETVIRLLIGAEGGSLAKLFGAGFFYYQNRRFAGDKPGECLTKQSGKKQRNSERLSHKLN